MSADAVPAVRRAEAPGPALSFLRTGNHAIIAADMNGRWLTGGLACTLSLACSTSATRTSATTHSVLERNKHPSRDGLFVEPTLTKAAAARMAMDTTFNAAFTGAMWASPLYLENGPKGKGVFFAVTTGNDVFALDESTGAIVWMKNIGPAAPATGAGCGSIHPLGILGTPVIDAQARTIYVAGAVGQQVIDRHEVHALSVDDGSERSGWPVDVSQVKAGTLAFTPSPHNQRGALSLVNGILYVPYGGHVGDCGPYHGWVVAIDTKKPGTTGGWATGGMGEGIWAAGGMPSDGDGVFAVTGNSTTMPRTTTHLDSEEVVRLTGLAVLDRATDKNLFFPARWYAMDVADHDFGSSSPVYIEIPGATPPTLLVALSKDGHLYLLDSKNLGGMDGHLADYLLTTTEAGTFYTAPTAYTTGQGVHVAFLASNGAPCPAGTAGSVIVSVSLPAGAPPKPQTAWCVHTQGSSSPITTTTDGKAEAIVWYMGGTVLVGVDGDTGQVVFDGGADACANVRQWTSPIAVKGRIVAGGDGHLCSWSPH